MINKKNLKKFLAGLMMAGVLTFGVQTPSVKADEVVLTCDNYTTVTVRKIDPPFPPHSIVNPPQELR